MSDRSLATAYGLNYAPRLANLVTPECPQCVQTIDSAGAVPAFLGAPDFSPTRVVVPGPDGGYPPSFAQPGAVAGPGYSPYVHIAGTNVVFDAPVVAVGDGPFDVVTHTNTHDRLLAIDTQRMTADLGFIPSLLQWRGHLLPAVRHLQRPDGSPRARHVLSWTGPVPGAGPQP